MNEDLLPDGGPAHPKKYRNRAAYNRALREAREAYWARSMQDPDFVASTSWEAFRPQFIRKAMDAIPDAKRGRKPNPDPNPRQKYQQVYQKARRDASIYYSRSTKLQSQFVDFAAYWAEHRTSWLPEGFLKPRGAPLTAKRQTSAKDVRNAYQIVYHHHARCWEGNIASCWERFGTWARYWEFVKAHAFVPEGGEPPVENGVVHDHFGFVAYSKIPPGWLGAKAPRPEPDVASTVSPITIARPVLPIPVAVHMETDVIPNDSEWLVAA